jgi:hypothetical protein
MSRSVTNGGGPKGPAEDGNSSSVRVCVRVRPLEEGQQGSAAERVVRCVNPRTLEAGGRQYQFDFCAHEGFTQPEFFDACGLRPLINAAIDGYASTCFAYGQTGSGKTYTMTGLGRGGVSLDGTDGLVPRSMAYMFDQLSRASKKAGSTYSLRASYYELYKEEVYDLLNLQKTTLPVRFHARLGFFVQGLFEVEIASMEDMMAVVDEGNANRRVASHLMNADSSRSHSILTVYLQSQQVDGEDGHVVKRFGKVSFVDLAGSERLKKTQAVDEKETTSINLSLMTLGKVISALSQQAKSAEDPQSSETAWVPYRDSTLTKLLMDSLGGNGLTLMLACVSPARVHCEETTSTLNYAARARNIRNRPIVQMDPRERLIAKLRGEIAALQHENEELRRGGTRSPKGNGPASEIQPHPPNSANKSPSRTAVSPRGQAHIRPSAGDHIPDMPVADDLEVECKRLKAELAREAQQRRAADQLCDELQRTVERLQAAFVGEVDAERDDRSASLTASLPAAQQQQQNHRVEDGPAQQDNMSKSRHTHEFGQAHAKRRLTVTHVSGVDEDDDFATATALFAASQDREAINLGSASPSPAPLLGGEGSDGGGPDSSTAADPVEIEGPSPSSINQQGELVQLKRTNAAQLRRLSELEQKLKSVTSAATGGGGVPSPSRSGRR